MQVADVGHFTGPLAAAPALLVQFRVHRLVSGRKMTVKQQERQQPRQHNPDNQPARAPGNPEQVGPAGAFEQKLTVSLFVEHANRNFLNVC
ncbi:Uncharacterised protein [Klebsiella pneumoniae]|uniref:Uncharacterized protein n=1 Tax=Klebsiella pneumoniae TaxID=573 RepID=A0A377XB93_KLEPN|nr:Uncharacterised protein [Klebsiella pneumoniae]